MSMPKGHDMGGVRTMADLLKRCDLNPRTDCQTYRGNQNSQPQVWIAAQGRPLSIGAAVSWLDTGKLPKKGSVWRAVCGNERCCNREHREPVSRAAWLAERNTKRDALTKIRLAKARRGQSRISDDDIERIKADTRKQAEIAAEYGITRSYVSLLQLGIARRQFIGVPNSIFQLGRV